MKKTGGRKSRWTVPFNLLLILWKAEKLSEAFFLQNVPGKLTVHAGMQYRFLMSS